MRSRLNRRNVVFSVLVGGMVVVILFGLNLLPFGVGRASQPLAQVPATDTTSITQVPTAPATSISQASTAPVTSKVIVQENTQPGTTGWQIPVDKAATTQIQAYASAISVIPGQTLTFYVSTAVEDTPYSIAIYRLGWYGGSGGRLMISQLNLVGHAQGYYDTFTHLLVGCHSCLIDTSIGLVEANWQPSYSLTVPSIWTTGVYLAKFTDVNGLQTYAPFDVRGNIHSAYVAVTSDITYAAYNDWGGASLYVAYNGLGNTSTGRGVKVSFDRPYAQDSGSGHVLLFEADAIHWLERQGYDLSYISDVDLHEDPGQLLQHRAYLALGHDEYWTKEMRDGVEHARDSGVGLAFLGANAAYWQIRFEPDKAGTANRTVVCYKVVTVNNDLARDPLYGKDNTRVTTAWRDPLIARPENAMIGIMYSGFKTGMGAPWQVSLHANSPLLGGTGLQPGQLYGCSLIGNEWDRVFNNGATPAGLTVLSVSHVIDNSDKPDISNTAYYIAPSGAMVFATGSHYWTSALDNYRYDPAAAIWCTGQDPVVPGMQKLMAHVMTELVVLHPSRKLTFTSTLTAV